MTVDAESRESKTCVRLHREDPEGYGRNRFILSLLAVSLHRGERCRSLKWQTSMRDGDVRHARVRGIHRDRFSP